MSETPQRDTKVPIEVWKRLGITQTFDLLLVRACMSHAGSTTAIKERASEQLSGQALTFWEMSFADVVRDLTRRKIIAETDEQLSLHDEFVARLTQAKANYDDRSSRVVQSEGMTLADIEAHAKRREERAQREAERQKSAKKRVQTPRAAPIKPAKRAKAQNGDELKTREVTAGVRPITTRASTTRDALTPQKLLTSIRVNRLFDRLEHSTLSKTQLAQRLDLPMREFERFAQICVDAELVRIVRGDLMELHWRGREYATKRDADRRMSVLELVKELRSLAAGDVQ